VKVAVLVPVARPKTIPALLESLASSQGRVELVPLLIASKGDLKSLRACKASGAEFLVSATKLGPGDFAAKIDLGYRSTDTPWIFQGAEDIEFSFGWADTALEVAERTGALVIGTNDEGNPEVLRGIHSTHSLISRAYCDDPGASMDGPRTVFSRSYAHNWTDAELVGVAKSRGVWAFCADSIVRHNHPHWGRGTMDSIYALGLSSFESDRRTFMRRRRLWASRPGNQRRPMARRR
jgi:hypothetical protein